jgi:putative hydrolase of the HAD superfamily
MIKALIFDVAGVLFLPREDEGEKNILNSFNKTMLWADASIPTSPETRELLRVIYDQSSHGFITKEETLKQMSELLGVEAEKIEALFHKIYTERTIENNELYDKVISLKNEGYKVAILSTQFHLSKDVLIPQKYYENFDALSISCDNELKKPEEKAFTSLLKELDVLPEESLFIDDQQKNIDAAVRLGMHAVLFESNEQLFQKFEELAVR